MLVERGAQLVDRRADAGEVRHRLEADLVADARDDLERLAAGRAAGAVGHADEVGRQRTQAGEREVEVRLALGGLGREELEGEHRAVARGVDLVDAHRAHGRAAAVKFGERLMPIHGGQAVLVLVCERSPVPPSPDARQPPIQGHRRRPGRRRLPAVVARPPARRRRAVARPARPRVDAGLRGPRR